LPQYAFSDSGTLAYIPGGSTSAAGRTLVWVDREGKEEPLGAPPNPYRHLKISPDGARISLTITSGNNWDIWVWDSIHRTLTRLTFGDASDIQSIWTLDGKRIVFASNREGNLYGLYWKAADGTGTEEKLGSMPGLNLLPWSWSGDGKTLFIQEADMGTKWDIGMLSMEGERVRKPLLNDAYTELNPKVSADGRYMAYDSNETGQREVYVRPFPDVDKGKWQTSTNGGTSPLWSPDGRELFYLSEDNTAMAVAVETKASLSFGTPKALFKNTNMGISMGSGTPWDIHPDGKRFLMIKPPASTGAAPAAAGPRPKINIVVNWFEELKQRVPVK